MKNWDDAMQTAANLADDSLTGEQNGLTDGSEPGDWRLPTVAEWNALKDPVYRRPALCNTHGNMQWKQGDPFDNVHIDNHFSFWTGKDVCRYVPGSGGDDRVCDSAHYVGIAAKNIDSSQDYQSGYRNTAYRVWPVRDDN